jgi:E3 ubiquitin-protein ligase DOA10
MSEKDCEELERTIRTNKEGSDNQNLCRICFSEQMDDDNPLISVCKCAGSLKFIHLECLRTWLSRKENVKTNPFVTSYSWKAFHCELCKSEYKDRIVMNDRQYCIFEIVKPKSNYVILESV